MEEGHRGYIGMGQMALDETEGSRTDIGLWRGQSAIETIEGEERAGAGRCRENKGH
jgi:hypothetical protein